MIRYSFFTKVTLVIVGLLSVTLITISLAAMYAIDSNLKARVQRELDTGARVFLQSLATRTSVLQDKVEVLAKDFAFRRAMATGDQATVESALANHGQRAGAGAVMWLDQDGRLRASTHHDASGSPPFPFPVLLDAAANQSATGVINLSEGLFQVVLVSIRVPHHIGWILMGFPINDELAQEQKNLTQMDISWLYSNKRDNLEILSSTLSAGDRAMLSNRTLPQLQEAHVEGILNLEQRYVTRLQELDGAGAEGARALLQISLDEAYAAYRELQWQLALIALLALLVSGVSALFLARSVSRPLEKLRAASARIASGNYSVEVEINSGDELQLLANTFNSMQRDLSDREERIVYQSQHDLLTGLPNRTVMLDRVETAIARARRENKAAALIAFNIRRFKEINDTMGQNAGDQVLRISAERLRSSLRATDTVLRLGSDDFLVVLEAGDAESLRIVGSNLIAKLSQRMEIDELQIRVNYMGGAAFFPEHGDNVEDLLRRTDIALNMAREHHESLHVYNNGEDEQHLRRVQIIADLPDAINKAVMFMVYQPKVSMVDRRASHVEALVRWIHPEFGFIPPDEFVTLAEQSGNVKILTHFVIRTVICQLRAWQDAGLHANIAVNLSALDLLDHSLPDVVQAYLNTYKVHPECLTFEITESALMQDPELAIRVLNMLKKNSIRLSIDDFGTGYSSLSQLKRLPVDELKIDKSFILHIEPNTDDAAIVRSTIELGHNLGLKVIAEGVENEEAWELLDSFGCDFVQGYLISKPMKPDDFTSWWKEHSAQH